MKRLLCIGGVVLLFLTFGTSSYAYQVDADVTVAYNTGIYTENYFNSVVAAVDTSALTTATLSVDLGSIRNWEWSDAAFYINGSKVVSEWDVGKPTWTKDVLSYLQDDGNLTVGIGARRGKFVYLGAQLDLGPEQAANTPIPPTILLFGSGLLGLVAFRKKFKMD